MQCKLSTYKKYCRFISPKTDRYNQLTKIYNLFIRNKIFTANEMKGFSRARWISEINNHINLDHKVSVSWGYRHRVPPAIMRHHCNCEFMLIHKNTRKGKECSITFDRLIDDIKTHDRSFDIDYHLLFCN